LSSGPGAAAIGTDAAVRRLGWLLAMGGAVAFSGKAIIVKLSYRHGVDAVDVIMVRMLLALPLFLALAAWGSRGRAPLSRRDGWVIAGLGFSGYYLASLLDFLGLQFITASLERLILYLNPTVVLLLGWALFKRRPTRRQVGALLLSYAGVLLVFGHEVRLEGRDVLLGAALVLASAVSYALYLIYSGEVVRRIGAMRLTGLATSVACVLCVAQFALLRPLEAAWAIPPAVWQLGVINAVACTFTPVLAVMLAIERIGAVAAAQAGMIGPLSTILLGVWLLDEPFSAWLVAGTALVLGGVWLLARAKR
jgi:drug/metabolite transporter (DMT)-like permease